MDWKSYEVGTGVNPVRGLLGKKLAASDRGILSTEEASNVVKKGNNTRLNSASLWRIARTLMARERVRTLGRGRIDPGVSALEMEADLWKKRREQGKVFTFTA